MIQKKDLWISHTPPRCPAPKINKAKRKGREKRKRIKRSITSLKKKEAGERNRFIFGTFFLKEGWKMEIKSRQICSRGKVENAVVLTCMYYSFKVDNHSHGI